MIIAINNNILYSTLHCSAPALWYPSMFASRPLSLSVLGCGRPCAPSGRAVHTKALRKSVRERDGEREEDVEL